MIMALVNQLCASTAIINYAPKIIVQLQGASEYVQTCVVDTLHVTRKPHYVVVFVLREMTAGLVDPTIKYAFVFVRDVPDVCVCACVRVRACVRACVRVCVRACDSGIGTGPQLQRHQRNDGPVHAVRRNTIRSDRLLWAVGLRR